MSKNKFFKKLLVAGLCALTATATVGTVVTVAGCKKDNDDQQQNQTQEYTVTFNLDGGKLNNQETYSVKVKDGEKVAKPANPTKSGYKFVKWVDPSDGTEFNFDTVIDSDLTLRATWEVDSTNPPPVTKDEYTVTIDLDGGTWEGQTLTDGKLVLKIEKDGTLGDALQDYDLTKLTKEGHTFLGWTTESGDEYDTGSAVNGNITIKASWKVAHQHTWAETWAKDDDGHYKKATCNDNATCETAKTEEGAHVDTNGDNKCDTCDYEATVPTGYTSLLNKSGVDVLAKDTFIVKGKLTDKFNAWGTAGIYYNYGSAGSLDTHYVEVTGGKAVLVTPSTAPATTLNIDFGGAYGTIEGYFELSGFLNGSTGYTPVQFIGTGGAKEELFGLRANTNWQYRVDAGSAVTPSGSAASIPMEGSRVYFKYESTTKKITVKINENDFVTDLQLNGTDLQGIKLSTGDGNNKSFSVDNIIVVNTPASVDEYKTATGAKYTALNTSVASYSLDLTEAQNAYTSALNAADTIAKCDEAYNTYYTAVLTALKTKVVGTVKTEYPSTNYTKEENKTDYEAAITVGETAVTTATTVEKAIKAETDWKASLAEIHPDSYYANAAATVTISDGGTGNWSLSGVRVTDEVTEAMLKAVIEVPAGQTIKGFYSDSDCTNALTLPMVLTSENTNIYVKFVEQTQQTETFKADDLTDGTSIGKGKEIYSGTTYKITNGAGGTVNKAACGVAGGATANDDSGLTFINALFPSGGNRSYIIKAEKDMTVVVYYTVCNGNFTGSSVATLNGQVTWKNTTNATQTGGDATAKAHDSNVAYSLSISLKSGESVEITSSANRLCLFGVVATYMG